MSFKVKASSGVGGEGFEIPSADTHPAVCVAVVDLGTQDDAYKGEPKKARKVWVAWELTAEPMSGSTFNHVVARDYTFSLAPSAWLRKDIEKWRGADFKDGEEFDLAALLGRPCLVTVSHGETKGGRKFARVESVTKPLKGQAIPPAKRIPYSWSFAEGEAPAVPDWLPFRYGRPVADVIKDADEWKARHRHPGPAAEDSGEVIVDAEAAADIPW